jgi:hypothetical protein
LVLLKGCANSGHKRKLRIISSTKQINEMICNRLEKEARQAA